MKKKNTYTAARHLAQLFRPYIAKIKDVSNKGAKVNNDV